MEGKREEEGEIEDAQEEKSFLELLCEADPSIEALEGFSACRPEFLSSSLTQWAPRSEILRPGETTENELTNASSSLKFSEGKGVDASGVEKRKIERERADGTCKCNILMGFNSKETKPNKRLKKEVSWFYVNMKKDKLEGRIAELHSLVKGPQNSTSRPGIASVFQETKELIASLLDQLKELSSSYLQHSQYSRHLQGEEERWRNGLASRGLCLVPTSAVRSIAPLCTKDEQNISNSGMGFGTI